MTPEDVVYVSLGDPIILTCLAEGTPIPEILWLRDNQLVTPSASLAVTNDGTELRISNIRQEDIGDYTCSAENGQGTVRHTTKLVIAGKLSIHLTSFRLPAADFRLPTSGFRLPDHYHYIPVPPFSYIDCNSMLNMERLIGRTLPVN